MIITAVADSNVKINVDYLLRHGRIITMDSRRRVLCDGTIGIKKDRIKIIGPDSEVAPRAVPAVTRDLRGAIVHPGFIDAHAHTISDITRGLAPENTPMTEEWNSARRLFYETVTPEEEFSAALLSTMEMVSNGTTTYADTGGSYDLSSAVKAVNTVGIRGIPGYFIADGTVLTERISSTAAQCLRLLEEQCMKFPFHSDNLVRCTVSLMGMGTASDNLLLEAKILAGKLKVPMIMHQSWDQSEVAASRERYGKRPIEHLAELGILTPGLTLVHMIYLDEGETEIVADSGCSVVHCPAESIRSAQGAVRRGLFPEMLGLGIPVALGSDGPNGRHDIARAAYLAAALFKEIRGETPVITAETALEMATINGAAALGLQDDIGSLMVGKKADLVIHRTDRPEIYPRYNAVSTLVYSSLSATVDTVMIDGRLVYENGHFKNIREDKIFEEIDRVGGKLIRRLNYTVSSPWPVV